MNSVQTMRTTAPVKTYIGPDSSRMVGDLLREQGVDSVLIVTGIYDPVARKIYV